ncbi:MAG: hypothetical protein R3C44_15150, partial [Chloroflexota bacterium]
MTDSHETIREAVQERYARLAEQPLGANDTDGCCEQGRCCGQPDVALDVLYKEIYTADTSWLPEDVTG